MKYAEAWAAAYDAYENRDWKHACELFRALQAPDDTVARLLLERCNRYRRKPPSDDWDGIERFLSK